MMWIRKPAIEKQTAYRGLYLCPRSSNPTPSEERNSLLQMLRTAELRGEWLVMVPPRFDSHYSIPPSNPIPRFRFRASRQPHQALAGCTPAEEERAMRHGGFGQAPSRGIITLGATSHISIDGSPLLESMMVSQNSAMRYKSSALQSSSRLYIQHAFHSVQSTREV